MVRRILPDFLTTPVRLGMVSMTQAKNIAGSCRTGVYSTDKDGITELALTNTQKTRSRCQDQSGWSVV